MRPKEELMYRETDDFQRNEFFKQLIQAKYLEGPALGITTLVIAEGVRGLSEKQNYVFQREVMDRFVHEECESCRQKLPWCEMFFAIDRGECTACDARVRPDKY